VIYYNPSEASVLPADSRGSTRVENSKPPERTGPQKRLKMVKNLLLRLLEGVISVECQTAKIGEGG
jgi:hypothetical protein